MSAEKIVEQIKSNVLAETIRTGSKCIDADVLLIYLEQVKNSAEVQIEVQREIAKQANEKAIETEKLNTSIRLKNYEMLSNQSIEMFKSIIAMGQAAIKYSVLINGAAAIAMMTFMGNVVSKTGNDGMNSALSASLAIFSYGALAGAVSSGTAYVSQSVYAICYRKEMQIVLNNFGKESPEKIDRFTWTHIIAYSFQGLALSSGGIAYWLFYRGISSYIGK